MAEAVTGVAVTSRAPSGSAGAGATRAITGVAVATSAPSTEAEAAMGVGEAPSVPSASAVEGTGVAEATSAPSASATVPPWAWPGPSGRPVPWAGPSVAWPRPQAHARALTEAPRAHMGVAGRASGSLAADSFAGMTFFTLSFYFSTKLCYVIIPKFISGFLGANPTSGMKFGHRN